ncbi:hypothetical protein MTR_3g088130 [Medicago truncatula]|uniref:OTU domain-containing protein n=1 Tax=Medicago truncatula TaxID=3880 RepID=G7J4X8_MEDTR|nr:hypothetical protein MTR_3g088130 [Medicago truncatula]
MLKFKKPFNKKIVDIKGNDNCGFWATTVFLGLTEESHIIVRRHLIQEVKDRINDPRELSSVGRDIAYYMQGLRFEPQTLHFSTI